MNSLPKLTLDSNLYALDTESSAFFKSATSINNDEELKAHILQVQAQAYAVAPLPCLRSFSFTKTKIAGAPVYKDVLKLGREREGALLLDVGCCLGNDTRRVVQDGFPARQVVASDLRREFWDLGHALFRSSPESFPVKFLAGDALDPAFLSPLKTGTEASREVNLSKVTTLNELRGQFSAVWAGSLFHVFSEKDQRQLAHNLASLLSPKSGSVLFGTHVGTSNKGVLTTKVALTNSEVSTFSHDTDSFKDLWLDGVVFAPGSVKVESKLVALKPRTGVEVSFLVWSVTRV